MELTKRLRQLTQYVEKGMTVADIGCDHGYVPVELIKKGICPKVIAMDVNRDPLEKARRNGQAYRVDHLIDYRLSNGLSALEPGEVDCIIIAGMGGKLIETLLDQEKEKVLTYKRFVLSPHRDIQDVRRKLGQLGLVIVQEDLMEEEGHYYPFIVAEPRDRRNGNEKNSHQIQENSDENLIIIYNKYGKLLIEAKHPLLIRLIQEELDKNNEIIHKLSAKGIGDRVKELEKENELGKRVLEWMES